MNARILLVAALPMMMALAACNDNRPGASGGSGGSGKTGGNPDAPFAMDAAKGGMMEVQLGQIALKNGASDAVKKFGQRMVTDHSAANDQLKSIAKSKGIDLPDKLDSQQQAMVDDLSNKNGAAFDTAYITAMIADHSKDLSDFRKEADSGSDPDLKSFASKTANVIQDHLNMAKDAATQLNIPMTGGSMNPGNMSQGANFPTTGQGR